NVPRSGSPSMLHAVIMAGGSGTRFWPKSRRNRPKQLLNLVGDRTMLQQTVARIAPLVPPGRALVVTGAGQAEAIRAPCNLGRSAASSDRTTRSVAEGIPTRSVGMRKERGNGENLK